MCIGFMGLGLMELTIARHLRAAGHALVIASVFPRLWQALPLDGAVVCASPSDIAVGCPRNGPEGLAARFLSDRAIRPRARWSMGFRGLAGNAKAIASGRGCYEPSNAPFASSTTLLLSSVAV